MSASCLAENAKIATTSETSTDNRPSIVAKRLDELIEEEVWSSLPADARKPAPPANDYVFLRRATLDVIGHPPTAGEITRFVLDPSEGKRAERIDQLLENEWYGDNWARYWRDVVMFRRIDDRARAAFESFREYLAEEFNANRSWATIATELITAEGDVRENGNTGIVMAQLGRPEETVAELSRVLLGVQIQCAQCHDHPFDHWEREQFHELAAFFPRVAARPNRSADMRSFVVSGSDRQRRRPNKGGNRYQGTLEHYMPDLADPAAKGELMTPRFFLSGEALEEGATDRERREFLAQQFTSTSNPWFAKSLVNRIWTELVGSGFFDAVDDIGPDRICHAPRTLDYLSQSFEESGHDLKWLFATIMRTDAYGRESRTRPSLPELTLLSNHPSRLRSDQLFNAITLALDLPKPATRGRRTAYGPRSPRNLFAASFGFDPSMPATEVQGSVPQALQMMNSRLVDGLISFRRKKGLSELARSGDDKEVVTELYLRCVSRPPTPSEMRTARRAVHRAGNRLEGLEDVLWALLNSSEFRYRS